MPNNRETLVIIGSGPAGLTAAIYAARANLNPLVIEGSIPGGQLVKTSYVENWPGEKSILGVSLIMNMKEHAASLGTRFMDGTVTNLDTTKPFTLTLDTTTRIEAQAIILAMGAIPKRLHCPGEDLYWGKGVTSCAVCDGAFYPNKKVLVIGGGDSAMESASFLKKFTNQITIVHILDKLTASQAMQKRILDDPTITIIYNSTLTEIKGSNDRVTHAIITNQKTHEQTTLEAEGIFLAIGLSPSTDFLKDKVAIDSHGYIQVTDHTKTSVAGIFAAGDAHDYRYRQAITAAGNGCMAALDVERYLSSQSH